MGDLHGNLAWTKRVIQKAVEAGVSTILQLGDFGYWPHTPGGARFLETVSKELEDADVTLFFIDGNHENFDELDRIGALTAEAPFEIAPRITYLPRGLRWRWSGLDFLAMGGAYSIDKPRRIVGASWWRQEFIAQRDIDRALSGGEVDVLVAHDAPASVVLPFPIEENPQTQANRQALDVVVKAVKPRLCLQAHYHRAYELEIEWREGYLSKVIALDCDGASRDELNMKAIDLIPIFLDKVAER